ncbi:hypothetical protein ES707_08261 [subsurface metagenome]
MNLTLSPAIRRDMTTATMAEEVLICPITPTEVPNVKAMSMRRSPVSMPGSCNTNLAKPRDGSKNLVPDSSDWLEGSSSNYVSSE